MKALLIVMPITLFSCIHTSQDKKRLVDKQEKTKKVKSILQTVGEKIQGDFNGDGQTGSAVAIKFKEGKGNPVEDGTADEYKVNFSASNLKPINAGCCNIRLINEGDLNNDGTDEISIFQAPINGCTYSFTTYSFAGGAWKQIIKTFLIPTGCDNISDDELQKRVFKENNFIYCLNEDPNDVNGKLVKKKATMNK